MATAMRGRAALSMYPFNKSGLNSSLPTWTSLLWEAGSDVTDESENHELSLKESLLSGNDENNDRAEVRKGSILSGSLNLLATMIGGEALALPLAFHQAGNGLIAPLTLTIVAVMMGFSALCLISASNAMASTDNSKQGFASLENVAKAAFGQKGKYGTMGLIFSICFSTLVAYAVILRGLLEPINDKLLHGQNGNFLLACVIMVVTPLTALSSLTSLKHVGAASITSAFVVSCCVAYRSYACNAQPTTSIADAITLTPKSFHAMLRSLPIFITVFVSHYNVLPVHNELTNPTKKRVNRLLQVTTTFSTIFYIFLGTAGSMYSNCVTDGNLDGNILDNFPDDDPIILFARICLTFTIASAVPMLAIPARNIIAPCISPFINSKIEQYELKYTAKDDGKQNLRHGNVGETTESQIESQSMEENPDVPLMVTTKPRNCVFTKPLVSILITWAATILAFFVSDVTFLLEVVGSSLSVTLAFIIPCASFIALNPPGKDLPLRIIAWTILSLSIGMMIFSAENVLYKALSKQ